MLVTCLFGKPVNVETVVVGRDGRNVELERLCDTLAPLPQALVLEKRDSAFRISRHPYEGGDLLWVGHYRPAFASGSTRTGSFYGSAVLCRDVAIQGKPTLAYLRKSTDMLRRRVIEDGVFARNITGINPTVESESVRESLAAAGPVAPGGLAANTKAGLFIALAGSDLDERLAFYIEAAQSDPRLAAYDALYLTDSASLITRARDAESRRSAPFEVIADRDFAARPLQPPPAVAAPPADVARKPMVRDSGGSDEMTAIQIQTIVDQRIHAVLPGQVEQALQRLGLSSTPQSPSLSRGHERNILQILCVVLVAALLALSLLSFFGMGEPVRVETVGMIENPSAGGSDRWRTRPEAAGTGAGDADEYETAGAASANALPVAPDVPDIPCNVLAPGLLVLVDRRIYVVRQDDRGHFLTIGERRIDLRCTN